MSIDYDAVCFRCKKVCHAGQLMGGKYSFGYGNADIEGSAKVAEFVIKHANDCGSVVIVNADDSPTDGFEFENNECKP